MLAPSLLIDNQLQATKQSLARVVFEGKVNDAILEHLIW